MQNQGGGGSLIGHCSLFIGLSKNTGDSEASGSPKSPLDCRLRSPGSPIWNGDKVGLSLINERECRSSRIVFGSYGSRRAIFISSPKSHGPAVSSKSLPNDFAVSFRSRIERGLSAPRSIDRSEDYTCIISRGPNPRTTHIFGDRIIEADDFLSVCFCCKKKLAGEDMFMYRGEIAFCSRACRSREIEGQAKEMGSSPSLLFDPEDLCK
ncbi:FCS-Like Zinc finger 10 [Wolffia australiana]